VAEAAAGLYCIACAILPADTSKSQLSTLSESWQATDK